MHFEPAFLEDWMRAYYFNVDYDLGSSGVQDFSLGEIRRIAGISQDELDSVVLRDSSSFGGDDVREAIAKRWGNGDAAHVMVTHGASEAIYLVMSTLLAAGDEVVAVDPTYHSHTSVAKSLGCRIVPWRLEEGDGFAPDIAALKRLVSARTKLIVVNFPHNPTGATLTAEQRAELIEVAAAAGAHLVWDAAFSDLVYGAPPLVDPTRDYDRAISIGTFSKSYGLPGLRFGWCMADPSVLDELLRLRDQMTLHLSPLVEMLALRVVQHADTLVGTRLHQARANRDMLVRWAAANDDVVDLPTPRGGVTAFPRFKEFRDTTRLCRELAEAHRVLLVPGAAFDREDRVRLGFGGPSDSFALGLDRLGGVLRQHSLHRSSGA